MEKVKEVVRLAERALLEPVGSTGSPRSPGRADAIDSGGTVEPVTPQPAGDWQTALQRYLLELPDGAIEELCALYRRGGEAGGGGAGNADVPDTDHAAWLLSRPDLAQRLGNAVEHL